MTQVSESHLLNIQDMALSQVQNELQSTAWFDWQWLDEQGLPISLSSASSSLDSVEYAKFCFKTELKLEPNKLVAFGDVSWQQAIELTRRLNEFEQTNLKCRLLKPTTELPGAIVFKLAETVSSDQRKSLMSWAEEQNLELCFVDNGPDLTKPGLLVMDMDSTAIEIECIDEIAKLAGVGEEVAKVTAAAMRGELDFAESLRARVKALKGAPVSIIDEVADNLPLMPGLTALVQVLQEYKWKIVIASGGFTYMTEALKRQLNLDETVANELGMADGKLTGLVSGDIVDAEVKARTVTRLAKEYGIDPSQTVAMGDGANDLLMLAAANLGVAFHAKPLVREKADVCVRSGGLDQLLYLL